VSSKLDPETGIVTVTAPCYSWCEPGHTLRVVGSAGRSYGSDWPDWVRRILMPAQNGNGHGNAYNVGLDTAEAELALAVRLGLVHPSLVEAPSPNGNGQLLASTSKEGYT